VDLYDGIAGGYYRDYNRAAPYNLYARTRQLLREAPQASRARDIGFRFGQAPPAGKIMPSVSAAYPSASFRFTWSATKGRWLVPMPAPSRGPAAGHATRPVSGPASRGAGTYGPG
jgi:hypothetical protein